jgi:predicted amidophosphoribosyltransferase
VAERYCRNCAQGLPDDSRFCANCGTPIQEVAHVPTPEVEVPEDPLQQIVQAHSEDVPPQPRSATSSDGSVNFE